MRALALADLRALFPHTEAGALLLFVAPLNAAFGEFEVDSKVRAACFLAQFGHETQGLSRLEENLRYTTVEALQLAYRAQWNALDWDDAWGYLNQPERLASRVYANRNGNGDEASGDGWKYRGRGLCHLTGKANYARAEHALGLPLIENPDLLLLHIPAVRAGGWYWRHAMCNEYADAGEFEAMTRAINGGLNGLDDRLKYRAKALEVLT